VPARRRTHEAAEGDGEDAPADQVRKPIASEIGEWERVIQKLDLKR
jgi:hypothetical protein